MHCVVTILLILLYKGCAVVNADDCQLFPDTPSKIFDGTLFTVGPKEKYYLEAKTECDLKQTTNRVPGRLAIIKTERRRRQISDLLNATFGEQNWCQLWVGGYTSSKNFYILPEEVTDLPQNPDQPVCVMLATLETEGNPTSEGFEYNLFQRPCDSSYTGRAICEERPKYVLIPASIAIDQAFKLDYVDLEHVDSAQLIQNVVTALDSEFSNRKDIDGFQFTNVTLLRKVYNSTRVDILVVSMPHDNMYDGEHIQATVNTTLKYLTSRDLGPYTFLKNLEIGQAAYIVNEYIESVDPEISRLKYVVTKVEIRVTKNFTYAFTDLLSIETQQLVSPFENELKTQLISKFDEFEFIETLLVRRGDDHLNTYVILAIFSLTNENPFNSKSVVDSVSESVFAAFNTGVIQISFLLSPSENGFFTRPVLVNSTWHIDRHAFTPLSFILDEAFKLEFLNLTHADTADFTSSIEESLNAVLVSGNDGFQIVHVTLLRNIDNAVGVDAISVSLSKEIPFNASTIYSSHYSALVNLRVGRLGPFKLKGDSDMFHIGDSVIENYIPVKRNVLTPITLLLSEKFRVAFLNRSHPNTNITTHNLEAMLKQLLSNDLDEFQFVYVTSLRKVKTNVGADINVVSLTSEETFDSSSVKGSVESAITEATNAGTMEPFKVQLLPGVNLDVKQLIREYVFTPSSFLLEKAFTLEFLNLTHADSAYLTNNIEESLNKQLAKDIDGFHFVYVTLFRKVKSNVGVNLTVVSLASKEDFNADLILTSVSNALVTVLSTGLLGPLQVSYTGRKDLHVEKPFLGPAPAFIILKPVFTLVSILVNKKFQLNYIKVDNVETKALSIAIQAEMEKHLESMLDQFQYLQVALLRPEKEGGTYVDLDVISLTSPNTFVMKDVEESVKSAVRAAIGGRNLGVQVDSSSPRSCVVQTLQIGGNPSLYTDYAVTRASLKLAEEFVFAFANKESNETRALKMQTEIELRQFLKDVDKFQFVNVVLLRESTKHTWIDINIGILTSEESFDAEQLQQTITDVMQKAIKDGDLGGYEVDTEPSTRLVVKMPQLGSFPPPQEYAFTGASMQLEEPWKKVYNDLGHPETEELIFRSEEELKIAFDEGDDIEVELIDLRSVDEKVSLEFEVASLTIVDEFNSTLVETTLIKILEQAVEDGELGGYKVNPNVGESIKLATVQLGKPIDVLRGRKTEEDTGALTPGTPAFIFTIVIACCCIAGTVFLVTSMVAVIKKREQVERNKQMKDEKTSWDTGATSINKDSTVKESRSSSSSSSEGP